MWNNVSHISGTLINRQIRLFGTPGMCHFLKLGWLGPLSSYVTTLFTLPHWDTQADQKILQKLTARFFLFEPLQKHKSPFPQRWSALSLNVKSADWLEFPLFWSAVFTLLADIWGWHNAFCWRYAQTQIRLPRYIDCVDAHVDLVYAGLNCRKVVSFGKDSYINEQCGQPDLNAAWSRSKILALHQTELRMPNLWTAIFVFSNISFVKKK